MSTCPAGPPGRGPSFPAAQKASPAAHSPHVSAVQSRGDAARDEAEDSPGPVVRFLRRARSFRKVNARRGPPPPHGAFRKEDGRPGAGRPPHALRPCPSTLRGPRSDEQSPAVTRDKPRFPGQRGYRCSACPGGRGQLLLGLGQRCHRPVTPPVLWLRRWRTGPAAPELQEAASPRPAARDVREDAASARAGVWGRPPGVWGCPGPNSGTLGLKASVESDSLFL